MNIGCEIKAARLAKGLTQEELGKLIGVQKSAIAKYENGRVINIKRNTLIKLFNILKIDLVTLMFGGEKMDNKNIFSVNLKKYMQENGKSRREVSEALGVSYYTFSDWVNGKKYPRMDKVEKLANYFGILKSDLIEDKQKQPAQGELSYKKREFIKKVEGMTDAQLERLEQILALVENTEL